MLPGRVLFALLLVGCAHETARPTEAWSGLLVDPGQCRAPAPETVSRTDAVADVKRVELVLRHGYAGFDVLGGSGVDWNGILAGLDARVSQGPDPVAVEDLRKELVDALAPTRDGHLAFWTVTPGGTWRWSACGRHLDAWTADVVFEPSPVAPFQVRAPAALAGSTLIECLGESTEKLVRPAFVNGPAARLVVLSEKRPEELSCRFRRPGGKEFEEAFALHRFRLGRTVPAGEPYDRSEADGMAVLRIASFGNQYAADLNRFAASSLEVRDAPAVILDARGNGGGSDAYLREWFLRLTTGRLAHPMVEELVSEVTLQGQVNRDRCDRAASTDPATSGAAASRLAQSERALAEAERKHKQEFRDWRRSSPSGEGLAPAPYRHPLVLIVDSGCGSSCEELVMYARQVPDSVIVGENTAGVGRFGEVAPFRLPRSGIWMQAGTKWFRDADAARAPLEGMGYLPDYWIDETDPVPTALKIARCLMDPACAKALPVSRPLSGR